MGRLPAGNQAVPLLLVPPGHRSPRSDLSCGPLRAGHAEAQGGHTASDGGVGSGPGGLNRELELFATTPSPPRYLIPTLPPLGSHAVVF